MTNLMGMLVEELLADLEKLPVPDGGESVVGTTFPGYEDDSLQCRDRPKGEETAMRNWIWVLGSLLVMVGCGDKADDSGGSAGGDGAAVYSRNCAFCHGANGEGGAAPALVGLNASFSESELTAVVTDGIGGTPMPAFGSSLTEEEIEAVVQFLLSEWG